MSSRPTTYPEPAPHDADDVSDTSSIGSGDWTDLSSAHPDDVSDAASLDGDGSIRPVSTIATLDDGSEEAWTTAEASVSPGASLYASAHAPLNPFEQETSTRTVHTPEPDVGPAPAYTMYAPLDPFRPPSDGSDRSGRESGSAHELQLILPDPLERSESTVAADLSFSDDVVLATSPVIVVSLAGVPPSIAQRATVVADVLRAVAKATHASYVRPDYRNFTTLSDLPRRVKVAQDYSKEVSVLVCDHTYDGPDHSHDDSPSILVAFTGDLHHSNFPQIPIHSILVPVVVNDAAGPVVLFDEERDDRGIDETTVDVDDLVGRLTNIFAADHHSETATQTAVDTFDGRSLASEYLDEAMLNTDYDTPDERSEKKINERVSLERECSLHATQNPDCPEFADALKHAARAVSPRWATACALAVMFSLLISTGHLIARQVPPQAIVPSATTVLPPTSMPQTDVAIRSPHTSLALKSQDTSLALKSSPTSLDAKSTQTALTRISHVLANESCSSIISISSSPVAKSISSLTATSLSTLAPISSNSLSTTTQPPTSTSTATCTDAQRAHVLSSVAEDLTGAIERIDRLLGWNIRETLGKAEAASKALNEATTRANAVFEATAMGASEAHQNARKNAQRHLVNIKRGVDALGQKVGFVKQTQDADGVGKDYKGKGKGKDSGTRKTSRDNAKARPGRDKWQTSMDNAARRERPVAADKDPRDDRAKSCKNRGKVPFPGREEQQRAQNAGRNKRPAREPTWTWTVEEEWTEYVPLQARQRTVMEEVREYIHHGFML
ncbi:actin cytoskeleton-regulatory complex protein pan1 [Ceratobasidium sp. AG-Ba]|nr:actin cytoskeleton-regulatory complex protein pan1 [Ceratobasidium sp. AG-Ba]